MPEFSYPGVYVEESPSGVHTIEGVATSTAAFVGRAWRGPVDQAVSLGSFTDYERQYGGLWQDSTLSYAVSQFFENGGTRAIVVRVATRSGASAAKAATIKLKNREVFRAASPGSWGLNLSITINRVGLKPSDNNLFNLAVTDDATSRKDSAKRGGSGTTERFIGLSVDSGSPQFVGTVLDANSRLLRLASGLRSVPPADQANVAAAADSGTDGSAIGTADVTAPANRTRHTGLYALDRAQRFNLLCLPPFERQKDNDIEDDWAPAAEYCGKRGAMLIVDAPASWTAANAVKNAAAFYAIARENAALYFPRVLAPDPLDAGKPAAFAPCGMVAGVISRTDATRGVWKAPAGTEATLNGATGLSINGKPGNLSDAASEPLNAAAINCLRGFPNSGYVVWGARTLAGRDAAASDWKYVPVRRFFLFLEESIYRGTQWVVFEPNDERLWAGVIDTVRLFLRAQWRQGALMGSTENQSFFVTCDRSTMTQDDILNGRLIMEIGIAPVRPAEFVIFRIGQWTASHNH
jgi:phage tail sheath protein FI